MLQVSDVIVASRWYQDALGLTSGHGGEEFEMLFSGDNLVLQLHRLDAHEHGFPQPDESHVRGAGVSLWFETSDRSAFEALFERAESSGATIVERPPDCGRAMLTSGGAGDGVVWLVVGSGSD